MSEEKKIKFDRLRYTKNSASSSLALLSIVFNVLFFVSIYQSDVASYYYTILIGASVLYNLVFMLMAFLASEGVKNYKSGYSWLLIALGLGQVVRIFIYPMSAHTDQVKVVGKMVTVMSDGQFGWCVACLILSALCAFASAAVNLIKSRQLSRHIASLGDQQA